MAHLSDSLHEFLNKSAGLSRVANYTDETKPPVDPGMVCVKRNRAKVGCVGAHLLSKHEGCCRCSTCVMGVSRAAWKGIEPSCQSCEGESASYVMLPVDQRDCPIGTLPWDVYMVKTNIMFSAVWACLGYPETAEYLDLYSDYAICNKPLSVLLAASHFLQLHTMINNSCGMAIAKQAALGRGIAPFHPALLHNKGMVESNFGSNHFSFTSFGLNYMDMRKSASALAGMAWGL